MAQPGREVPEADELFSGDETSGRPVSPWVWRVAGLLVVAGLAWLVGPDLLSGDDSGRRRADRPSTGPVSVSPVPSRAGVPLAWATRGPAVGSAFADEALAAVRRRRADTDRLLWAGTVDGRDRVALFSFRPSPDTFISEGVEVGALRVPAGGRVSAARLQSVGSVRGVDGRVGAAWVGFDGRARLLVIGRPAPVRIEFSAVTDYRPDGTIGRSWHPAASPDGVVVTGLGRRTDPVLVVRPARGTPGENFLVDVAGPGVGPQAGGATFGATSVRIGGTTDPSYAGPDPATLSQDVVAAVSSLVDVSRVRAKVIWSGDINVSSGGPGDSPVSGRGALVLLRRDDGPVFQAFVFTDRLGALNSFSANAVPWAVGDRLPYAFSTYDDGAPLLVLNPGGAGSITATSPVGEKTTVRIGPSGVGVLAEDANVGLGFAGSDVVVRDRRGRVVLRSALVDVGAVDPYGLYL